jgi:hypothetical protein
MWNRTYRRLLEEAKAAEERGLQLAADRLGIDTQEMAELRSHYDDV